MKNFFKKIVEFCARFQVVCSLFFFICIADLYWLSNLTKRCGQDKFCNTVYYLRATFYCSFSNAWDCTISNREQRTLYVYGFKADCRSIFCDVVLNFLCPLVVCPSTILISAFYLPRILLYDSEVSARSRRLTCFPLVSLIQSSPIFSITVSFFFPLCKSLLACMYVIFLLVIPLYCYI